mmetsp:Transcript_96163/g.170683  ORF Transcript_96163/g.170683 Transcript_96163/m.170683 type:complete len:561 (+) Transcript_96163:86-1768(+)|eukprot:CAMPEP_0197662492 /NCGR_PEP_ID=MMETSP1338-20131121/53643_1 /TAXON_ID=43686 ORGANISM="Pelagodinium beii, Strain RCC1491" /NCGR_SAMPLE_ID=MMETSP1338 /ASSEMBLY_ACC=CAM_ASM_000754 /LENGTH=560 /DNA_ID=CAMNT_0043240377 /DNA_START=86 /DNA_END=1768 /DNA_ORIENTATION=+
MTPFGSPEPPATVYALLQKAKPYWSSKDLCKVHEKLQKVSINDCGSLARAVSEGTLNNVLASAGERKLKSSTLAQLRMVVREPYRASEQEKPHPLVKKRCFCGACLTVPMCEQRGPGSPASMKSEGSRLSPSVSPAKRPVATSSRFSGPSLQRAGFQIGGQGASGGSQLQKVSSEPTLRRKSRDDREKQIGLPELPGPAVQPTRQPLVQKSPPLQNSRRRAQESLGEYEYPQSWRNVSLEAFEELGLSASYASNDPLNSTSETEVAFSLDGGAFAAAMEAIHIPDSAGSSWRSRVVEFAGTTDTASVSSSRRSWRGFRRSGRSIAGGTVGSLRGVAEEDAEADAWLDKPTLEASSSSEVQMPTVSALGGSSVRFSNESGESLGDAMGEVEHSFELAANTTATTNAYTTFGDALGSTVSNDAENAFAQGPSAREDVDDSGGFAVSTQAETKSHKGFGESWGFVADPMSNSWDMDDEEDESEEIQPLAAQSALFNEAHSEAPPPLRLFPVPAPIGRSQPPEEVNRIAERPSQLREQKPADVYHLRVKARGERQRRRIISAYG